MAELFLEILGEEMPAHAQSRAAEDLKRLLCDGIRGAGLEVGDARTFVTPRRLGFVADGIPERTPDISEERKGPATNAPQKAVEGFLNSVGLTADRVEKRNLPKGEFYVAMIEKAGTAASDVLPRVVEEALAALPWAKSMKWADHDIRWVRPLRGIICLFDGAVLDVSFGPVSAGNTTIGHRFLSPDTVTVSGFADYKSQLRDAKIIIDPAERRGIVVDACAALAAGEGLTVKDDRGLVDEVVGLVEWPVPILGRIDDAFMDLPPEVLIMSMRSHQKCFACLNTDGSLANRFVTVANTETRDGGDRVRAGNERVLKARLADARFFWDQDRRASLASRAPALRGRVFHARLGSLDHKADRMQALAIEISRAVPGSDRDSVRSAARLAKTDLFTGMVGEFPDLQGIMGRYYALHDGESADVADAIAEHYAPQGPSDRCPANPVSVCVALADKIDTLVGFFGIDEKPTGSKDPFALRRAALGVIRLIIENRIRLPLLEIFDTASDLYNIVSGHERQSDGLLAFFADRLKVHLRAQGVRHDLVDAVFAPGGEDDFVRLLARVEALQGFLGTGDGMNLLAAYKRAANILRIEEKKDGASFDGTVETGLLQVEPERVLNDRLSTMKAGIETRMAAEDFAGVMMLLADSRPLVDAFFNDVTVNADDAAVRVNRLNLLASLRRFVDGIADFSRIEG